MFIDQRHHKNSERRRRGMLIKRDNEQHAPPQHATPLGLAACLIPRCYKHFNPTGFISESHWTTSEV